MVELRLWSTAADNDAAGAVSQNVHVRIFDGRKHAFRHHVAG
jgi:hypothetical protein